LGGAYSRTLIQSKLCSTETSLTLSSSDGTMGYPLPTSVSLRCFPLYAPDVRLPAGMLLDFRLRSEDVDLRLGIVSSSRISQCVSHGLATK